MGSSEGTSGDEFTRLVSTTRIVWSSSREDFSGVVAEADVHRLEQHTHRAERGVFDSKLVPDQLAGGFKSPTPSEIAKVFRQVVLQDIGKGLALFIGKK